LTVRYKGQVNVMSLGWTSPISLEPPLIALAIHPSTYTHDMLTRAEELVLNIPGRPLAEHVITCGTLSGADEDKIQRTGLTLDSAQQVDVPWIGECLAHIECAVVDALMPGDHTVFLTQVVDAWAEEAVFRNVWRVPEEDEEQSPLLHLGGRRFALMGKTIEVS
jgi:flavin reductase (DIM6/NTAB) family NADH-FMN oxidoreductase RutF